MGSMRLTAVVRGLSGEHLARGGTVFVGLPPVSAGQLVICGFVNHIDEHFGGIRRTIDG
jgi:hypothetical protein